MKKALRGFHITKAGKAYCGVKFYGHAIYDVCISDTEILDHGAAMVTCDACLNAFKKAFNKFRKARKGKNTGVFAKAA